MFDRHKPLDSFDGVGEGKTATVALAAGVTYDCIHFFYPYSAVVGAELDKSNFHIRLNLNGEDIIDCSAENLVMIEAYEGNAEVQGIFSLSLRELIARTAEGDHATGLVTMKGDAISMEVDINGAGAGATVTLKAIADTRTQAAGAVRVNVPKLRKYTYAPNGSGAFQITNLPKNMPVFKRIHFIGANITDVMVSRDDVKLYQMSKAQSEYIQKRYARVPQAGVVHFDPIIDGYAKAKVMSTRSFSMLFELTMSAAGTADALVESVWPERQRAV